MEVSEKIESCLLRYQDTMCLTWVVNRLMVSKSTANQLATKVVEMHYDISIFGN